mmetsp:Transcript_15043/g.61354  ORF Transcript_15043/g.61354 Transcript_15043/m.61354 type:complete len:83 (-) Transcript_15043:911-1159(-)
MEVLETKVDEFDGRIVAVMKSLVELENMAEVDNRVQSRALGGESVDTSVATSTSADTAQAGPRVQNIDKKKRKKQKGCCVIS